MGFYLDSYVGLSPQEAEEKKRAEEDRRGRGHLNCDVIWDNVYIFLMCAISYFSPFPFL